MASPARTCTPALLIAVSFTALAPDATAQTRQTDRISDFPETLRVSGRKLVLNGKGLCEWGLFGIDLYWAGLYLEEPTSSPREIVRSRQAKVLELRFARALSREQLIEAWTAAFTVNAGDGLAMYRERLDRLNAAMLDVEAGDSMRFTFLPQRGLQLRIGKRDRELIEGEDFSRMFFTLYLGSRPPDEDLRRGLLGGSAE